MSFFADKMILYTGNPKDATKKLLQLMNEFGNVAGYKINTQKSVGFLYTNNELSQGKLRKQSHCIKKNKIPRSKSN